MDCRIGEELLEPYLLGALDVGDRALMEGHLESCSECGARVREEGEAVTQLAYAVPGLDVPPRVKQELFSRIDAEAHTGGRRTLGDGLRRAWGAMGSPSLVRPSLAAFAVVVAAIVVGGVWFDGRLDRIARDNDALEGRLATVTEENESQSEQLSSLADENAVLGDRLAAVADEREGMEGRLAVVEKTGTEGIRQVSTRLDQMAGESKAFANELDSVVASYTRMNEMVMDQRYLTYMASTPSKSVSMLKGMESTVRARGMMLVSGTGDIALLAVLDLPALRPNEVYEAWLIKGGTKQSAGVFTVDPTGYAQIVIKLFAPLEEFDAIGITREPAGARVLQGDL